MKLLDISTEAVIVEVRRVINQLLAESISDYLSLAVARLKSKTPSELFMPGPYQFDLDQFAEVIAGLKVLSKADYRETLTHEDLGIDPNDFRELFKFLQSVTRDGKEMPKLTRSVFASLKHVAPSLFKKTRDELEVLKSGRGEKRTEEIRNLSAFVTKANEMFNRVKHQATSTGTEQSSNEPYKHANRAA